MNDYIFVFPSEVVKIDPFHGKKAYNFDISEIYS